VPLGAARATLAVFNLDAVRRGILEAIRGQPFAALDLNAGLQREQDEERHNVGAGKIEMTMQIIDERAIVGLRLTAPHIQRVINRKATTDCTILYDAFHYHSVSGACPGIALGRSITKNLALMAFFVDKVPVR
jgi:hypothetical protein